MVARYERLLSIDYSRFDSRKQEMFGKKRKVNHPLAFMEKLDWLSRRLFYGVLPFFYQDPFSPLDRSRIENCSMASAIITVDNKLRSIIYYRPLSCLCTYARIVRSASLVTDTDASLMTDERTRHRARPELHVRRRGFVARRRRRGFIHVIHVA